MPDAQEVFRMATQKVRPDPEALERQRRKQRSKARKERATVYAVVAGLVVAVAIAGISTLGSRDERAVPASEGREPSVSAEPSPDMRPPFTERFDSPLHGVSISYPSGWRTRAATEPWGHGEIAFGAPDVDVIFHPRLQDELYFAVVSIPLGARSGPDWVDSYLEPSVAICRGVRAAEGSYTLDGAVGKIQSCYGNFAGGHVVAVATATRAYIIYLHVEDERRLQGTYDQAWFEAALETVDLRPQDAVEPL